MKDITYCKYKSFEIIKGERIIKVDQFGTKTADECMPFGEDSVPLKNYSAVYANTSNEAEKIIIGYINTKQLSKVKEGEKRIYSLKGNGDLSIEFYLRKDGKAELGGNADNLVKWEKLNTKLQNHVGVLNTEFGKIATAITTLGGVYVAPAISLDISDCKVIELLCP